MPFGRATPIRPAGPSPMPAAPRPTVATLLAVPAAVVWRDAPDVPVAPVRRRPPAETVWATAPLQREPQVDLAALARAIGAGGLAAASPTAARMLAARDATPPTAFPDTGRIVDAVMERLDRRLRSDHLRRGL